MHELAILREGFRTQRAVVFALILREAATRHGKTQLGYLWEIILPLSLIMLKIGIFSFFGRKPDIGESLFLFFATGLLPFLFWTSISRQVQSALTANQALLAYPPVQPLDLFLARGILEASTIILVSTLIFSAAAYFGVKFSMRSFPELFILIMFYFGFALGMGMINASIIRYFPSYANFYSALTMPMFFISGIFYTASTLPVAVREWVLWAPMLQYSEWMRSIFYPGFSSQYVDVRYLFFTSAGALFLGMALNKLSEREPV